MMEVLQSQRGGKLLVLNDFLFNYKNKNSYVIYWRCSESQCAVAAQTDYTYNLLRCNNDHNHGVHREKIEKIRLKIQMLSKLKESPSISSKTIFDEVRRQRTLDLIQDNDVSVLPKFETLKSTLNRHRRKQLTAEPESVNYLAKDDQRDIHGSNAKETMPVDLRNPRNMNKSGGGLAIPSGPFQHFHHLNFANPSSVLVPIATGSSGHASGPYHESTFHINYLKYSKLLKLLSEAFMQHFHQANNVSSDVNLNVNVNGKAINNIEGEQVKGFS
uniref:FLYWCH-type domain-containing protein n=1 Tax=Tetranychus urticae TaxID=32264 RepID=T1KWU6_TETUR